ncbi:MAG: hypothetical protein WAV95_14560 [Azonexus sp.]
MPLYDYLYVDLPKVISLYSQLTGGVLESRETTHEHARNSDNKRSYDFKVFRHDAGGTANDKSGSRELVKPHHAVLVELEHELAQQGYLFDLTAGSNNLSFRDPDLRQLLKNTLCIKVTGRAAIEDYERMKGVSKAFPEVTKFVNKSIESGIKESPAYKEIEGQLELLGVQLREEKDRNKRALAEANLRRRKAELAMIASSTSTVGAVENWILEGFRSWVDTFLPGIINLRIYPSVERPDEQVFGHLKREYFEDADTSSFHFTYGSLPTENVSLIGIVTAIPGESFDPFNPLAEFLREGLGNAESVEMGFRGLFRGFDGLEQLIRTCRFPRVLVQPVVVYRSVEPNILLNQRVAAASR